MRYQEIEKRFRDLLDRRYSYLTFRFSFNKSGLFLAKKKFVLQDRESKEVKVRGLRRK